MNILMNHQILKLLNKYAKEGRIADEAFIKKALNIYIHRLYLKPLIKETSCNQRKDSSFDYDSKSININPLDNSFIEPWEFLTIPSDRINAYNIQMLYFCLKHIKEAIKFQCLNPGGNIAEQLTYISVKPIIEKIEELKPLTKIDPRINPLTRYSEIDAAADILKLTRKIGFISDDAHDYYRYLVLSTALKGYINGVSPIEIYLLQIKGILPEAPVDSKSELVDMASHNNLGQNIYLGLPISTNDYKFETARVQRTRTKLGLK